MKNVYMKYESYQNIKKYSTCTAESFKFLWAIFEDRLNFTGSWGRNLVYFQLPTKRNYMAL